MDTIIKSALIYLFLWAIVRLSGRRTIGQMTAFDLVLFLVISGAVQRALTGQDYSIINAVLIICTFVGIDVLLTFAERGSPAAARFLKGMPMIVVENGRPLSWRMKSARLTTEEVLEAGRRHYGLERMDQIKFAILEASGEISIVPSMQPGQVEVKETKKAD